ncbi:hypothetical protein BaRGS_00033394 [Batillaria attramentaria]|uniref:Uncharacterized protein n=1 Tax=Batillaria attramentaria TaxID=370345 RepID=A0ABD0JKA1_9CAEN
MAALSSMCMRSACGLSRAARSYLGGRAQRADVLRMSTTATNGRAQQAETEGETTQTPPDTSAAEKALTEQKLKLEEELKELKDKYMRSLAETENVRQRMKKQVDDAKLYGIQGFCKDMLEVADILHVATLSVPTEELTDATLT